MLGLTSMGNFLKGAGKGLRRVKVQGVQQTRRKVLPVAPGGEGVSF